MRGARVEQQAIDKRDIFGRAGYIRPLFDGDSLHHRQAKALFKYGDPFGLFLAMKLQHVRLQRLDERVEKRVVDTDRERPLSRPPAYLSAERPRDLERHISRRRREKDKAHHVGAAFNRRVNRFGCRQATDFYRKRHLISNIMSAVREWRPFTSRL